MHLVSWVRGGRALGVGLTIIVLAVTGCGRGGAARQASPGPAGAAPASTAPASTAPAATETEPPSDAAIEAAVAATEEPRSSTERLKTPAELQLYPDRKRFLSIQAAAANTEGYERPHDLGALARLIRSGELQPLPELGKDYVLDGVGEDAKEPLLTHWDADSGLEVPLLADPADAEKTAADLAATRRASDVAKAALLRKLYADPKSRAMLTAEYEAITGLARDFQGEVYDLQDPEDRVELEQRLLSSLRPAAREVMLELAAKYHARFNRLLPIVSMVRTERYQRLLSRVNPNATHIDVAPHTTGEAFDITYRSMASDEQNFLMAQIAALEDAGRVEALRENRNCFHVFAFASAHPPPETAIASARAEIVAERAAEEPERTVRKPRRARRARRRAR